MNIIVYREKNSGETEERDIHQEFSNGDRELMIIESCGLLIVHQKRVGVLENPIVILVDLARLTEVG